MLEYLGFFQLQNVWNAMSVLSLEVVVEVLWLSVDPASNSTKIIDHELRILRNGNENVIWPGMFCPQFVKDMLWVPMIHGKLMSMENLVFTCFTYGLNPIYILFVYVCIVCYCLVLSLVRQNKTSSSVTKIRQSRWTTSEDDGPKPEKKAAEVGKTACNDWCY